MKKYSFAFFVFAIMTIVTSVAHAGLSPRCIATLEIAGQDLEGITLQRLLRPDK